MRLDTSSIFWPAVPGFVGDSSAPQYFEPSRTNSTLFVASVVDLSRWEAFRFEWLSPLGQWEKYP